VGLVMVGIGPTRVISFVLLVACGALCQEREETKGMNLLPDAPGVQAPAQGEMFRTLGDGTGFRVDSDVVARAGWEALYKAEPVREGSGDFFRKHLYANPTTVKRSSSDRPESGGLMGRATYAASRTFITRDESGKGKLNTAYFLRVMSAAVLRTAYRPYWNRPVSAPLSNFGSTVGNDAGMNVLHEFTPGLEQLVKNHTPKFVSKIEQRVNHK
jgi:hypothetical protein